MGRDIWVFSVAHLSWLLDDLLHHLVVDNFDLQCIVRLDYLRNVLERQLKVPSTRRGEGQVVPSLQKERCPELEQVYVLSRRTNTYAIKSNNLTGRLYPVLYSFVARNVWTWPEKTVDRKERENQKVYVEIFHEVNRFSRVYELGGWSNRLRLFPLLGQRLQKDLNLTEKANDSYREPSELDWQYDFIVHSIAARFRG